MTRLNWLSLVVPLLLGASLAAPALASPPYPVTVQLYAGLPQAPDCVLCHRDDLGGAGTVIRPFGRSLIERFAVTGGNNIGFLKKALKEDDDERVDSDGDGVSDLDELRMGTNPNVGVSGVEAGPDVPLPETGCALVARSRVRRGSSLALLLVALGFFARRARRPC